VCVPLPDRVYRDITMFDYYICFDMHLGKFYENRIETADRLGGTGTSSNGALENRYVQYE